MPYTCRCQCSSFKEHVGGINFRAVVPANKVTIDRTDNAFVETTEHFSVDRQDVAVKMTEPVTTRAPKETRDA